jgi:hypothetical protein
MMRRVCPLCLLIVLACASAMAAADEKPALRAGGLLFGDLYHVPSHHSEAGDGASGLVLRRGYLTFNADFSDHWFGRLRFEVNQSGEFETYQFDTKTKDLFLGRKFGRHRALLGLSSTPTFDVIESIWGLRYLARTPMDLQGVASRDTGLAVQGPLNTVGSLRYRVMYAAPVEFGGDSNDRERWMGAVGWQPAAGWTIDLYADYEALDGPRDRSTRQLFLAWQADGWRWGLQYSNQDRQDDPPLELASAFVVSRLSERVSLVGRVDRLLEPSPRGDGIDYLPMDPSARATMMFAGVEFRLNPYLALTPNAVVTTYDRNDQGVRPATDVYLRLTLFVDFE